MFSARRPVSTVLVMLHEAEKEVMKNQLHTLLKQAYTDFDGINLPT